MDYKSDTMYSVPHEDFKQNKLSIVVPFSLASPKLLLNGVAVSGKKNTYIVTNDFGKDTEVFLKFSVFDSAPDVLINKTKITIAPKLKWYEYVLMMLPFSLATFGGAIGGGLGFVAMRFNNQVLRSNMTWFWKIFGCFLFTTAAAFIYFMLAIPLSLLMR